MRIATHVPYLAARVELVQAGASSEEALRALLPFSFRLGGERFVQRRKVDEFLSQLAAVKDDGHVA